MFGPRDLCEITNEVPRGLHQYPGDFVNHNVQCPGRCTMPGDFVQVQRKCPKGQAPKGICNFPRGNGRTTTNATMPSQCGSTNVRPMRHPKLTMRPPRPTRPTNAPTRLPNIIQYHSHLTKALSNSKAAAWDQLGLHVELQCHSAPQCVRLGLVTVGSRKGKE